MTLYIARRFLGFLATLLIAAAIIFVLLDLLPGDPARFILGINASDASVAALRTQMRAACFSSSSFSPARTPAPGQNA